MWRDKRMKINYRDKVAYLMAMYDAEGRRLWPRATKQAAQPRPATKGVVLSFERRRHTDRTAHTANLSRPFGGDAA